MTQVQSSPRIQLLSTELANQIAAGEVIERPASVVKELIENSLDAGATRIEVQIEKAGVKSIVVKDNGHGIHKEDLQLALSSHATSKLRNTEQLQAITSLGFRGEALPSIAAVSRFELHSRQTNSDSAWSINEDNLITPSNQPEGTYIAVKDLFHNIPGRRKFLKSERTESLHIQSLIRNIALSHCGVSFVFIEDGKKVFHLIADLDKPLQRIQAINGKTFVENAFQVDSYDNSLHLWGWLGAIEQQRSSNDKQNFFVNGRYVKDKLVNHAIRIAYGDKIFPGRYAVYVLYMDIDPAEVDVNVHPAKHEIRFRNGNDVHDFISASIQNVLAGNFLSPTESNINFGKPSEQVRVEESRPVYQHQSSRIHTNSSQSLFSGIDKTEYPESFCIQGYLFLKLNDKELVVDLKKFREWQFRYRYETAKSEQKCLTSRPILVPINIQLSDAKVDKLKQAEEILKGQSVDLQQSSPGSILVRAIPAILNNIDIMNFIHELTELTLTEENILQLMVRHYVMSSPDTLNESERQLVINEIKTVLESNETLLQDVPWRYVTAEDVEKLFKLIKQ